MYKTKFKYGFNSFNGLKWLSISEFDTWEVDFLAGSYIPKKEGLYCEVGDNLSRHFKQAVQRKQDLAITRFGGLIPSQMESVMKRITPSMFVVQVWTLPPCRLGKPAYQSLFKTKTNKTKQKHNWITLCDA